MTHTLRHPERHASGRRPARIDAPARRAAWPRAAFSLLETTIAVGILGIGLILVAAIFPAALTQHRESTDQARAIETIAKAQALIGAKVETGNLWVHTDYLPGGLLAHRDSPWYLLPTVNLRVGNDCWDVMVQGTGVNAGLFANFANGAPVGAGNTWNLHGLDILSDRVAPFTLFNSGSSCTSTGDGLLSPAGSPFTDAELMEAPNRQVWYGFYRRLATGSFEFAAAACKQRKNQIFAEQDATVSTFTSNLSVYATNRRLPVPWRVLVSWEGGNVLTNALSVQPAPPNGIGLAELAPVGTKLIVRGGVDIVPSVPIPPPIGAGVVLTVSDIIDNYTVEFVGDSSGLLLRDPLPAGPPQVFFDVWVFPPSVETGGFGRVSPLLDWRVPL